MLRWKKQSSQDAFAVVRPLAMPATVPLSFALADVTAAEKHSVANACNAAVRTAQVFRGEGLARISQTPGFDLYGPEPGQV
jgi:hypothetical protein